MATKYYAVLTNVGAAKLANATALGAQVEITQMAVGDGNGVLPTPNPAQTALVHELRRKPLNSLSIDPNNANQIIAEQVIPEDEGGWWIREIGLFDKDGDMSSINIEGGNGVHGENKIEINCDLGNIDVSFKEVS